MALMLMAYQAELLEELGTHLDSRDSNLLVWEEACNITDINLRSSCGAVQSCSHSMALAVAGKRLLWLNLLSIGDREKLDFLNTPVDSKGLFDLQNKKGEAFDVCLPRKKTPCPPTPPCPIPSTQNRTFLSTPTIVKPQGAEQSAYPPAAPSTSKPWGKQSFEAAATKSRSTHPSNRHGVFQSPKRDVLSAIAQSSVQADCLEHGAPRVTACDTCPRSPECRG